jgi:hypothetical protein
VKDLTSSRLLSPNFTASVLEVLIFSIVRVDVKTDLAGVEGQACGLVLSVLRMLPIMGEQSEFVGED